MSSNPGIHPLVHAMVELGSDPPVPSQPAAPTTEAVVASMLTENTGRHMLDSGGAYGRSWEQNQGRNFDAEPPVTASWKYGYIDVTLNLYHFLTETLEYMPVLDEKFHEWATQGEMKNESWFVCIEEFVDQLKQASDSDPEPPFDAFLSEGDHNPWSGEDIRSTWTVNTYNHDSLLSQVIQWTMVGDLVFLQVHGGCDVRGGYTQPRVFKVYEEWPAFIDDSKATIYCTAETGCGESQYRSSSSWTTDDGYHWYGDGSNIEEQLEKYEAVDISEDEGFVKWRARLITREVLGDDPLAEQFPTLRAYDSVEDHSICPVCNVATLAAGY